MDRWKATTTLQEHSRLRYYVILLKAGEMGDVSSSRLRRSQELDPRDRGRIGGDRLPHANRRLDTADGRLRLNVPEQPLSAKARAHHTLLGERILSGLSGMGVDSPAIRPTEIVWGSQQPTRAHRAGSRVLSRMMFGQSCYGPGST